MTKFKFGDKVFCIVLFGNGIYMKRSYHGSDEPMCYVLFENYGLKVVELASITKVSDWIPCSERMPETYTKVLVLVEVGNDSKQHIFVDELYESTKYGMLWQNNDNLVTHWMPLPAPPPD